jgi:PTH1 family peptidyl-tRNA hydrolase
MYSDILLFVGLGNPGAEYQKTRHNVGFVFLDYLADFLKADNFSPKFNSLFVSTNFHAKKILLLKPQTFMNKSGLAVSEIVRFYKIPTDNIYVFIDDLDLEFGKIKVRTGGGSAGHKGIKSIDSFIDKDYHRLKFGIGRPQYSGQVTEYVLSNFSKSEQNDLESMFEGICNNLEYLVDKDPEKFLNLYHQKVRKNGT